MNTAEALPAAARNAVEAPHAAQRALTSGWTTLLLLAGAIVQQSLGHQNADNSWLISVAEHWLAGTRPYVDVLETNPPGAFLIYAPAVAVAHLLGLRPEMVVSALIVLGTVALLPWLRARLVHAGAIAPEDGPFFINAGLFALVLLPGFCFAEREHLGAICVLPMLATYALRSLDAPVPRGMWVLAGLLAGIAIIAKPHFALALLLPFAWLLWQRPRLALFFVPEHAIAACLIAVYLAALPLAFPAFFDVLPAILEVYVPVRAPLPNLISKPWLLGNLGLLAAIATGLRRESPAPLPRMLLLGSVGFVAAFLLQMKGWVNHGYPGVALAFLSAGTLIAPAMRDARLWQGLRRTALLILLPATLGAPILFGTIIQVTGWEEHPGLTDAVRRLGPVHPRLASITGELDVGHPLVRRVGGTWAMRPHSLWLMTSAMTLLQTGHPPSALAARLRGYIDQDARMFREDVGANKPDLILAQTDGKIDPVLHHPDIMAALADYAPVEVVGALTLYRRRN